MRFGGNDYSKYGIILIVIAVISIAYFGGLLSTSRIGQKEIPAIWRYYEESGELNEEVLGNSDVMDAYPRVKRRVLEIDSENKYEVSRIFLDVEKEFELNLDDTIVDNMKLSVAGVPYEFQNSGQRFENITVELYVADYGDELQNNDWESFDETQKITEWKYPSDASNSVSRSTDLESYIEDGDLQLVLKIKNDMNTFYSGEGTGLEVENMVLEWEGKDEETFESKEDVSEIQFSKSGISVDMSWKWWLIMIFVIFAIGLIMGGMGGMK